MAMSSYLVDKLQKTEDFIDKVSQINKLWLAAFLLMLCIGRQKELLFFNVCEIPAITSRNFWDQQKDGWQEVTHILNIVSGTSIAFMVPIISVHYVESKSFSSLKIQWRRVNHICDCFQIMILNNNYKPCQSKTSLIMLMQALQYVVQTFTFTSCVHTAPRRRIVP